MDREETHLVGSQPGGLERRDEEHPLDMRGGHDAEVLLKEMQRLADEQAKTMERFTTQARQAFAYIAGFFTIAQAAAVTTLTKGATSAGNRHAILIIAIVAGVGVLFTGIGALFVEAVRTYKGVGAKELVAAVDEADSEDVPLELVLAKDFEAEVKGSYAVLRKKLVWLRRAQGAAAVTIILVGGELMVALASHI